MAAQGIILYTAKLCPFAHRVELAFQEAKADVTKYEIDLKNKPDWYATRVNPASKVPAVVYGSPKSDPEHPTPESAKITESLVLLEFIADLYPDSGLLPKNPIERARVRFFIDAFTTKQIPQQFGKFFRGEAETPDTFKLLKAMAEIQDLLPPEAQFAVGEHFTIADAAILPFLARWELHLQNDLGKFVAEVSGPGVYDELFRSERFARLQKYYANISGRDSFKNTFDSVYLLTTAKKLLGRD